MKRYSYKKIPKYKEGSFLEDNAQAIQNSANFLADASNVFGKEGKANVGLKTGQGVLKGAAMGASFGPLGAGVGALVGGVTSFIGGQKQKKELERQEAERLKQENRTNLFNSGKTLSQYNSYGNQSVSYYRRGGNIPKYPDGGIVNGVIDTGVKKSQVDSMPYLTIGRGTGAVKVPTSDVIQQLKDPNALVKTTRKDWDFDNLAHLQSQLDYDDRVDGSGVSTLKYLASRNEQNMKKPLIEPAPLIAGTPSYKYGGVPNPQYEVEKDEVVQGNDVQLEDSKSLSSDMELVGGESHENGGTLGKGGERVYSDTSKIDKPLQSLLKDLKISLPKSSTHADIAKKIGAKKGKYEKDVNSPFKPKANSARLMLERFDEALDATFANQEERKAYKDKGLVMKYGGVPKYAGGKDLLPDTYKPTTFINLPSKEAVTITDGEGPKFGVRGALYQLGKKGKELATGDNAELLNFGNYLSNLGSINKLDTSVKRRNLSTPVYSYTDRSGQAKEENQKTFNSVVKGLSNSSRGVNMSNIGAAYAATLDANNKIQNNENQRKDAYDNNYNQRVERTEYVNTATENEANDLRRELYNNKYSKLPLDAKNAYLKGVMANKNVRSAQDLDLQKATLQAYANDNNGVMSRIDSKKLTELQSLIKKLTKTKR